MSTSDDSEMENMRNELEHLRARCEAAEAEVERLKAERASSSALSEAQHSEIGRLRQVSDERLARSERLEGARQEAMRLLDHPPGITFNQQSKANVEAWLVLKRAALADEGSK